MLYTFGADYSTNTVRPFDDSRFSDFEIGILDQIIGQYGHCTSEQLADILRDKSQSVEQLLDTDYKKAAFEVAYQSYLMESDLM